MNWPYQSYTMSCCLGVRVRQVRCATYERRNAESDDNELEKCSESNETNICKLWNGVNVNQKGELI